MKEVNDLLNRLGELEDAPLIWVNKKVYDMAQEIERLKEENTILKQTMSNNSLLINENAFLKERIDKAIEYIYLHSTQRKWFADISDRLHNQEIQFKGRIQDLLDILKGDDKE